MKIMFLLNATQISSFMHSDNSIKILKGFEKYYYYTIFISN